MPNTGTISLRSRVPILQSVLPINPNQVPSEIVAGLTLAAIAIPEVMGYTKISGTPVITGLYTMLVPTALFAVFGSSRHLVVGADSATAAILAAGLAGIAPVRSDQYLALSAVLAIMAGAFVMLARIVRLGFMADFLSRTVLIGFLTGVGIQVALGQLAGMLGLEGGGHGTLNQLLNVAHQIDHLNVHGLTIALGSIVLIVAAKKISRKIPGELIAIIGAIAIVWATGMKENLPVVGSVPSGLPHFGLPKVAMTWNLVEQLAPTALAMSVVILAQSAATSSAYAARYRDTFSENSDLVGLAMANFGAGLSSTFVVNGSPTKTQMVDSAGGRTQLSLLVTTTVVLLVLLFLTAPLSYLPEAVLSAVVFLIGIDLIDLRAMREVFLERRNEFWVALTTVVTVVFLGVEQGILLAIALSLVDHTRHGYAPKNVVLVPSEGGSWRTHPWTVKAQALPGLVIYRFTHSMYYANSPKLVSEITDIVDTADPPLRWLCLDASAVDDIDFTAAGHIRSLFSTLNAKGVRMVVAQLLEDVRVTSRYELERLFGKEAFYATLDDVVADYKRRFA
jgi:high affinity sulfate transporter 1